ncbi:MAG: alpha/beta fold hydrolase [Syntrophomonadaceae bacterium]|nr:alpha/beta fold hydrolase [Syntrophomonadaceae bacterium]
MIKPGAEDFFLPGSDETAILFIHGITASPSEVYPTAKLVNDLIQCTVKGVLLPGHGTSLANLSLTRWTDWYNTVKKETEELQKNYSQVYLAGLSMGGLLSLYAGMKMDNIAGVISINAPIFLRVPLAGILAPVMRLFIRNLPKVQTSWNQELNSQGRFNYDATPIDAFESMWQLRHKVVAGLKNITIPLLVMQSIQDETVRPDSGRFIVSRAVNAPVELVELKSSRHVATMDREKETIARKIADFIKDRQNVQ